MPNNYLQNIKVKGYKSIKDLDLKIENLNILIGQNGAGKSNFISLFKFLRNIIEERLQNIVIKSGGAENLLFYGSKQTKAIEIDLDFSPNGYAIRLASTDADMLFIVNEYCGYMNTTDHQQHLNSIGRATLESSLKELYKNDKVAKSVYDVLKAWRVYHFHDTSETAGVKKFSPINNNRYLLEDASNLAAFLYSMQLRNGAHYDRIVKTVQLAIPFFNDFNLLPNVNNPEIIGLEWRDKNSDRNFNASALSDGSLRFICLATLLLQPELPKLILLDEPELGLHPAAITVLAGLLRKAAIRSQVIVSTQSVNLVNEFDPTDIIVVDREENASVFHRLDSHKFEKWLDEYSMGDLWEKNIIGGRP